jgi:hypothetical protein
MTDPGAQLLERAGRACSSAELAEVLASGSGHVALVDRLEGLATEFQRFGATRTMTIVYGLVAEVARKAGLADRAAAAEAQRDYAETVALLLDERLDDASRVMDAAGSALLHVGERQLALDGHALVAWVLALSGRTEDALHHGGLALDAFEATLGGGDAEGSSPTIERRGDLRLLAAPPGLIRLVTALGRALVAAPAREAAADFFARESRVLRAGGHQEMSRFAEAFLGITLVRLGEPERALEMLEEALAALRGYSGPDGPTGPLEEVALSELWFARAFDLTGRDAEAERRYREHPSPAARLYLAELLIEEERHEEALAVLGKTEGALARALAARAYALLRRPAQREAAAEDARELLAASPNGEAAVRARLALIEQAVTATPDDAGELAAELHRVAEEAERLGMHDLAVERVDGDIRLAQGAPREALERYEAALEAQLRVPARDVWMREYGLTGTATMAQLPAAEYRRARQERGVGTDMLVCIAGMRALLGEDAGDAYEAAIEAASRRNRRSALFHALAGYAAWKRERGEAGDAARHLERAADALEAVRADLHDVELQVTALADREFVYSAMAEQALERDDAVAAVRVFERAKSRALLDYAASLRQAGGEVSADVTGEVRLLRSRVLRTMRRLFTEGDSDPLRAELAELKDRLAAEFRDIHRGSAARALPAASPDQVAELAPPGTALLHYFCAGERVLAAVVADGRIGRIIALPDTSPRRVEELLDVFAFERAARLPCQSLTELHQLLIEPLERDVGHARRILVVPHGILHSIPFAALRRRDGSYLIEHALIATAPSAALARAAQARQDEPAAAAPGCALALDTTDYLPLSPLDGAAAESEAAARTWPGLDVRANRNALRQSLLRLDGDVELVHLACHGEFDADDPLLSRLYLADGPMYGYELLDLRCRPRLVVLSACETGVGERRSGDELFGLTRPFLGLGTAAVVASLWKVTDASTAELMHRFYAAIARLPRDAAGALQEAQLAILRTEAWSHPHHWAAHVLTGGFSGNG